MEVMQYIREEATEKTKEAVDEVEEVIEEALLGRRRHQDSQRSKDDANGTTFKGDESSTQSSVGGTRCGYQILDVAVDAADDMKLPTAVEEVDDNNNNNGDTSKEIVFLNESKGDSQEGSDQVDKIHKVEPVSAKLKDLDINKVLSAVINGKNMEIVNEMFGPSSNLPISTKPQEEHGTTSAGTEHLKIDIVDENDDEVLELEFERAVEKMHTHNEYNMYCPNCSNRITKVILRRRKKTPAKSQDLLGCLSCFSIFIPKGNILDPFKIFGRWNEPGSSENNQEQQPLLQPGSTGQPQLTPGGSKPDKGRDPFSTSGKPAGIGDASDSKQPSLPVDGANQPGKPTDNIILGNVDGTVLPRKPFAGTSNGVSSADGSISNGDAIINILPDGTTVGTRHPLKPIGEIEEGSNATNGQYPGDGVQGPLTTDPSHIIENLTDATTPLIPKLEPSSKPLEILKSIVYGGLMESITSLSIVSSAAASDATTLNIMVLGLANLAGGFVVLFHNLKELRNDESNEAVEEVKSKYYKQLGRKENFLLHTFFAVLSYIVFGLIPPVVYGFTFREMDDRDHKLLAVGVSSLVCVILLAIAKAYTLGKNSFKEYTKTVLYYVTGAVSVSGIAYGAGHLLHRFMENLGWFDSNPVKHLLIPENNTWTSF